MESLKKAMKWDEDVYGLEYDLVSCNRVTLSPWKVAAIMCVAPGGTPLLWWCVGCDMTASSIDTHNVPCAQ